LNRIRPLFTVHRLPQDLLIGAATDLGLKSQDGERVSAVLLIDDRRFCLSLEPAQGDMDGIAG
jgi:hypothetical protein